MESNRHWQPAWGTLDVVRQKTLTMKRVWRTSSFSEAYEMHVPYDTFAALRAWQPDVIITGEMGARSLQAVLYARLTNTPVALWGMLSEHTESSRSAWRTLLRRRLVRAVDFVIVNGESGARYIRGLAPGARIVYANQAIDLEAFLALPRRTAENAVPNLLHVGTLSERKGIHLLIPALARIDRRVRVTFVGDGPLSGQLKQLAGTNAEVVHAGNVPYEELPRWYAGADALLFPSLADEWGLVVNEALAAGVPVMGSTFAQAVTELVRDGENGWTFTPDSADTVAAALQRVLATPADQLAQMRAAARERVESLTPAAAARKIMAGFRA